MRGNAAVREAYLGVDLTEDVA
ncbi:hypothetical protein ACFSC4_25140 [Deinococcus malanensis]